MPGEPKLPKGVTFRAVALIPGEPHDEEHGVWIDISNGWKLTFGRQRQAQIDADRKARGERWEEWQTAQAASDAAFEAFSAHLEAHDGAYHESHPDELNALVTAHAAASDAARQALSRWGEAADRDHQQNQREMGYLIKFANGYTAALQRLQDALTKDRSGTTLDPPPDPNAPRSVVAAGYRAVVKRTKEAPGFEATVPVLPGLRGTGGTEHSALTRLEAAIPGYLAALRAMGKPLPEPAGDQARGTPTVADLEAADRALAEPPRYRPRRP